LWHIALPCSDAEKQKAAPPEELPKGGDVVVNGAVLHDKHEGQCAKINADFGMRNSELYS